MAITMSTATTETRTSDDDEEEGEKETTQGCYLPSDPLCPLLSEGWGTVTTTRERTATTTAMMETEMATTNNAAPCLFIYKHTLARGVRHTYYIQLIK
jgi:hypothetical protein